MCKWCQPESAFHLSSGKAGSTGSFGRAEESWELWEGWEGWGEKIIPFSGGLKGIGSWELVKGG